MVLRQSLNLNYFRLTFLSNVHFFNTRKSLIFATFKVSHIESFSVPSPSLLRY